MTFIRKLAAFVLLSALINVACAGQAIPRAAVGTPSGGCHHGGELPAPQPVKYTCCQAGHNSAILLLAHGDDIGLFCVLAPRTLTPAVRATKFTSQLRFFVPSSEPPGSFALRI